MPLNRIVVGIDFSANSNAAARWARMHFASKAELSLVHVIDVPEPPAFLRGRFPQTAMVADLARQGAQARLADLITRLGQGSVHPVVRLGRPAEQLAALARETGADAIIVGKHGEHGGAWERVGGVADQLLRVSPVPVLVATGLRDTAPRRILVAMDDADITPLVVQWAGTLSDSSHTHVTAFHVISSAVLSHVLSLKAVTTGQEVFDDADIKREFHDETDRWIRRLTSSGLDVARVTSEVAFGEAGQEILAAAERLSSDLIVLGRRGAGRIHRFFLGSVARAVLAGARCPVFVVVEPHGDALP